MVFPRKLVGQYKIYARDKLAALGESIKVRRKPAVYWKDNPGIRNWGDDMNPWLFSHIVGKEPVRSSCRMYPKLLLAGSILSDAGPKDECWGTGFISVPQDRFKSFAKVHAVRGRLTAEILGAAEMDVPSVYGDPGLLVSRFIEFPLEKRFKVSVVPHYCDIHDATVFCREHGFNLIPVDIGIEDFMQRVSGSERVVSSSLHGIICAESFGVEAHWVKFTDLIIGGDFKFFDYISGTGRSISFVRPLDLRSSARRLFSKLNRPLPSFNVEKVQTELMDSFPIDSFASA